MSRSSFGRTWWGEAWLEALEGRAIHDPNRLPRGRTYARRGTASSLTIAAGRVQAEVQGTRPEPYQVLLTIRVLRPDEWDCVLDAILAKAAHSAALLDGELHPGIVEDARSVEVELLPRSGELRTACSCPDWAEPCKHAAALCYLVATALDEDPFVLLTLRGMSRDQVIEELRARRGRAAAAAASGAPCGPGEQAARDGEAAEPGQAPSEDPVAEPGVLARWAWERPLGELPAVPSPALSGPGRPAPWPSDPPPEAPFTTEGLQRLAADAARRAWELRAGIGAATSGLDLDPTCDRARRAAAITCPAELFELASRCGRSEAALRAESAAWKVAGARGVRILTEESWNPPVAAMAEARSRLVDLGASGQSLQIRSNRITWRGREQYRLGRDGCWYRFEKAGGRWTLTAGPGEEIDDLAEVAAPRQ